MHFLSLVCVFSFVCLLAFVNVCLHGIGHSYCALPCFLKLTLTLHSFIYQFINHIQAAEWAVLMIKAAIVFTLVIFSCHIRYTFHSFQILRHRQSAQSGLLFSILTASVCFQNGTHAIHKVDWFTFASRTLEALIIRLWVNVPFGFVLLYAIKMVIETKMTPQLGERLVALASTLFPWTQSTSSLMEHTLRGSGAYGKTSLNLHNRFVFLNGIKTWLEINVQKVKESNMKRERRARVEIERRER